MDPLNKVSIIIPCYNQAQFLDECLSSVLNQTYNNWECIIVDDGSPDNTGEVAQKWMNKDARFKYVKKENGGLADARNYGINNAQGEWLLPLDSDDKISEQYLEKAAEKFKDYDVIYAKAVYFGEKKGEIDLPSYSYVSLLLKNNIYCTAFYKKDDYLKTGGYDVNMKFGLEDWEFWIHLLKNKNLKVHQLNYIGFHYRIKEVSMLVNMYSIPEKRIKMLNYIFNKHFSVYMEYFNPILNTLRLNNEFNNKEQFALNHFPFSILLKVLMKKILLKLNIFKN